jgi:hypothetical protein
MTNRTKQITLQRERAELIAAGQLAYGTLNEKGGSTAKERKAASDKLSAILTRCYDTDQASAMIARVRA